MTPAETLRDGNGKEAKEREAFIVDDSLTKSARDVKEVLEQENKSPIPDVGKPTLAERELKRSIAKAELKTRIECWGVFVRGNPRDDLYEDQLWELTNFIEENAYQLGEVQ